MRCCAPVCCSSSTACARSCSLDCIESSLSFSASRIICAIWSFRAPSRCGPACSRASSSFCAACTSATCFPQVCCCVALAASSCTSSRTSPSCVSSSTTRLSKLLYRFCSLPSAPSSPVGEVRPPAGVPPPPSPPCCRTARCSVRSCSSRPSSRESTGASPKRGPTRPPPWPPPAAPPLSFLAADTSTRSSDSEDCTEVRSAVSSPRAACSCLSCSLPSTAAL
mmetsp:Transcript_45872/g.116094  ORF Transcript_45872/g.116094 Transcript_45872/m.116094 type:complete len:223 (+) Transcript_45872:301-969(+)